MEDKIIKIEGTEFKVIKWDFRKRLRDQNKVLPIIKDPMVNIMAVSHLMKEPKYDEKGEMVITEEDTQDQMTILAASIDGVFTAMSGVNMEELFDVITEGCGMRLKTGGWTLVNIETFEKEGLDISVAWSLIAAIIKHNYGGLLKNALADSLSNLLMN